MIEITIPTLYADPPAQVPPGDVADIIRPLLFSDRSKVGSNVKFDIQSLFKYYDKMPPGPYHDTIVLRHILNENLREYGLKPLTYSTFGWRQRERDRYPDLGRQDVSNFGLDEVARYLNKDLRYAWLLFHRDTRMLVRKRLERVYEFEMALYPVLMEMEYEGFPVDFTEMESVRSDLLKRIGEIEHAVWKEVGDEFPLSNTEHKRWVMFGYRTPLPKSKQTARDKVLRKEIPRGTPTDRELGTQELPPLTVTEKTQTPQITKTVLDYYANQGNPIANALLEWSALEKLRGTFIEGFGRYLQPHADGTQRLHTGFKQHGTVTGRLTSSGAEPPAATP